MKRPITTFVPLYCELKEVIENNNLSFEIIFMDDGSTDSSCHILEEMHKKDTRIKAIQFRKNFGKAAAISVGFEKAEGEVVITMDTDLQDNPKEIPRFGIQVATRGFIGKMIPRSLVVCI